MPAAFFATRFSCHRLEHAISPKRATKTAIYAARIEVAEAANGLRPNSVNKPAANSQTAAGNGTWLTMASATSACIAAVGWKSSQNT